MSASSPSWPSTQTNLTIPKGCMVFDVSSLGFIPWDNPDNIMSQATEQTVDRAVALCLPILFLISVPSNILSMLVFWTQGLKERINLCLFYLSLVDFCHMIVNFLFSMEKIPQGSTKFGVVMEFIIDHFLTGFVSGFTWLSGFISMVIASERCLCVVSPLRSQTFLKTKTTAVILVTATVLILSGSMLVGARWSVVCVFNPMAHITSKAIFTSDFYTRHRAYLDVLSFLLATLQVFIYVIVVAATTVVTSVKLRKMAAWREQTSTSSLSSREVALTRMLIAVSALYVICSIPIIVLGLCILFVPDVGHSGRYYNFFNFLISWIELASFINATFNFFVYCFLGSKFKETLRKILRCKTAMSVSKEIHCA